MQVLLNRKWEEVLAICRSSLSHLRKHSFISVLHWCRMENDKFSLEDSSEYIDGELLDTTVAIFMPIGVEIINKNKNIRNKKTKQQKTYFNYIYQN